MSIRYFYYRRLDFESQEVYRELARGIRSMQRRIILHNCRNIEQIINAVKDDNPQFFYVNWFTIYRKIYLYSDGTIVNPSYLYTKNQIKAIGIEIARLAKSVKGSTDEETVKLAHNYLAKQVKYNMKALQRGGYRNNDHTIIGPLLENLSVCEGIAKAMQLLLRYHKIGCTLSLGKIRGSKTLHAWNMVELGGKRLYIDVTWDLSPSGVTVYRYFCKTKSEFEKTHIFF